LPDFGLSGNRRDGADLLLFQSVDDTALADIGITNETNRDLLFVRVQDRELPEQLNEGTFTKRVVDRGVECDGGCGEGEVLDPTSLSRSAKKGLALSSIDVHKRRRVGKREEEKSRGRGRNQREEKKEKKKKKCLTRN
jgi:hypothetical protein